MFSLGEFSLSIMTVLIWMHGVDTLPFNRTICRNGKQKQKKRNTRGNHVMNYEGVAFSILLSYIIQ